MAEQPMLRDVIDIKQSISTSDFVLRLAEAVTEKGAEAALRDYVVTERLLDNFAEALGLIKSALDGHTSKAVYLHGSFGSGKSHFMAVLYALLSGNQAALSRSEFDPVLTRHEWLTMGGKNFLLVPYHMLGAKALEQRVLGEYVKHVHALHPDAPIPQVYRTDTLFADLRRLRESMGDEAVIRALQQTADDGDAAGDEDEWGEPFAWTSALLDTALAAEEYHEDAQEEVGEESSTKTAGLDLINPTSPMELRAKLVQDASTNLLPGFAQNAAEDEHGFISLDAGLSVIAEHAKGLGYDGLILFLDELILWLATLIHDQKFVAREASKITNFVEGADARRAIPVVSFIARQRDLRELVGEEVSGAAEASIQDTLNLASGRFDKITLEDRNLPQVAHARLLTPRDAEADRLVSVAFDQTKRLGPQIWDALLGSDKGTTGADEESFRLTYPFSPAFMDTLVHISSALQRSRTGLKLMGQLLADHRDDLRLGDLVAVGDLYEVIATGGDKPFVDSLKVVFEAADKLYRTKLRPYLLGSYEVTEDDIDKYLHRRDTLTDVQLAQRCELFVADNRLVCTLLLSALAPSVPALSDLTIRRLGALNHGSVKAPIPGSEVGIIKDKVTEWVARFPEIKETGTSANPGVRLELSGVDVDSVIANAAVNDNPGNRAALARRILSEELGVEHVDGRLGGADELHLVWQGSDRTVEILFGNVADEDELADHDLQPQLDGRWRIVVDLPFDEGSYGPAEDLDRIRRLRDRQVERSRTIAWVPAHLSKQRFDDFRRLVIIDKALSDEQRFATQYAVHLNADNRERARGLLETQKAALLKQLKDAFKQAYGLKPKEAAHVERGFDEHVAPIPDIEGLTVQFGQSMREAIRHISCKLLAWQFPDHPELDPFNTGSAVRAADARIVFTYVRAAAEARDRRVEIPVRDRKLMERLAQPLGLGQQKEAYFELSYQWADDFRRLASTEGVTGDLSLTRLTDWIDRPQLRGLETFLANLIVASFAEMDDRVWVRGGVTLDPSPELSQIRTGDALRNQPLPSESDWQAARERFEAIFGERAPTLLRGRMVNQFARQITGAAQSHREAVGELIRRLEEHSAFLGLDETDDAGRLQLARRSLDLLKALETTGQGVAGAKKTIEALARFDLKSVSPDRYGTSVKRSGAVSAALVGAAWDTLDLAYGQGPEGATLLQSLRGIARADQRTADLVEALRKTASDINMLIKRNTVRLTPSPPPANPPGSGGIDLTTPSSVPPVPGTPPLGPNATQSGSRAGSRRTTVARAVDELARELAALPEDTDIEITWRVVDT